MVDIPITHKGAPRLAERQVSPPRPTCKVKGCESPVHAFGRCAKHYQQYRRSQAYTPKPGAAPVIVPLPETTTHAPLPYVRDLVIGALGAAAGVLLMAVWL